MLADPSVQVPVAAKTITAPVIVGYVPVNEMRFGEQGRPSNSRQSRPAPSQCLEAKRYDASITQLSSK